MIGRVWTLDERRCGAYFFEAGLLHHAPMLAGGGIEWNDAVQVDFYSIDEDVAAEARIAEERLLRAEELEPHVPVDMICRDCRVSVGPVTPAQAGRLRAEGHDLRRA